MGNHRTGIEIIKDFLVFIPVLVSVLGWLFTKPTREEERISRLRKSLLESLRLKIAIELENTIPLKEKKIEKDEYVAICIDKLNEYFSSNSLLLIDFLYSDRLYKSYIHKLRCFKYGVFIIPCIGIIIFFISKIFPINLSSNCYIWAIIVLFLLIVYLWLTMERRKDTFHDLCARYEVMNE